MKITAQMFYVFAIIAILLSAIACKDKEPLEPCVIEGRLTAFVIQDRSTPNTYRILLNDVVVAETTFTEPENKKIVPLGFNYTLSPDDSLEFVADGSNACFVGVNF